jgi:hypothetical protein
MLTQDFALLGTAGSTRTYIQNQWPTVGSKASVRAAVVAAGELEKLTIKHDESTRSGTVVKTHLMRLDLGKVNATTQKQVIGSVHCVITAPQDAAITNAHLADMVVQIIALMTPANIAKILNDES